MPNDVDIFHQNIYEQTFGELKTLNKTLPEDAIFSLAREVLHRVVTRGNNLSISNAQTLTIRIDKLTRALISDDGEAGADMIRSTRAEGTSLEDLYLVYLVEAARTLGVWWEEDRISLVDVTVGTGRIYAIMRGLSPLFPLPPPNGQKAALFTAVPGETHTLGVKMAADLFRTNGWDIDLRIGATNAELAKHIQDHRPRIVGLSAGGKHAVEDLARLIIGIRISSPATTILVSGQIVHEAGDLVKLMGPDAIVSDFAQVEDEMERLWYLTTQDNLPQ